MKKLFCALFVFAAISSYSFAETSPEAKACYKRCMDQLNDKKDCEYICYKKKD
jgi:hypothetical protein